MENNASGKGLGEGGQSRPPPPHPPGSTGQGTAGSGTRIPPGWGAGPRNSARKSLSQASWKWKISHLALKERPALATRPPALPYKSPESCGCASHPLRAAQSCFPSVQGGTHIDLTSSPGCCIPYPYMHSAPSGRAPSLCVWISTVVVELTSLQHP